MLSNAGPDWVADEKYGEDVLEQAEEIVARLGDPEHAVAKRTSTAVWSLLARMIVTRDDSIMPLAAIYLSIADLLAIRSRMVGTGLIGGKTVGMLIARKIINAKEPEVAGALSSRFLLRRRGRILPFLVRYGLWHYRENKIPRDLSDDVTWHAGNSPETFPDHVLRQFEEMLAIWPVPGNRALQLLLEEQLQQCVAGNTKRVFGANQANVKRA